MPSGPDYIDANGIPTTVVEGEQDMVWPAVAGAAVSSALDFAGNKFLQDDAQKFNAIQARDSRSFIREQMLNKHQWQAEDLEKAGLNRILSLGGAALGGTATASSGMNSGSTDLASKYANLEAVREQNKLRRQQIDQSNATTDKEKSLEKLYREQARSAKTQADLDSMVLKFINKYPDLKAIKIATDHAGGPAGLAAVLGAGAVKAGLRRSAQQTAKKKRDSKNDSFFETFFNTNQKSPNSYLR